MSAVEIVIRARDEASRTLQGVKDQLTILDQFGRTASDLSQKTDTASRSFDGFEVSTTKATRAVRALVDPIVGQLSPALSGVGAQMAAVITHATVLTSGLGAVGVAAAGAAAIVGGQLVAAWQRNREEMRAFGRAVDSGDFDRLSAQIDETTAKIVDLSEKAREARERGFGTFKFEQLSDLGKFVGIPSDYFVSRDLNRTLDFSAKGREERERLRDVEVPGGTTAAQNAILGAQARSLFATQQGQRGLYDFLLTDPLEAQYVAKIRAAEDLERAGDPEGADKARKAAAAQRAEEARMRSVGFRLAGAGEYDEGAVYGLANPENLLAYGQERSFEAQRYAFIGSEAAPEPGIEDVARFEGLGAPGADPDAIARARKAVSDADIASRERVLSITSQILDAERLRTDLSQDQMEANEAAAIEAERQLKLEQAKGDAAKITAANLDAQAKQQALRERTELVPGLLRGLTDVETEFGSMGVRMQSLARSVADGMAQSFSDGFFDVLTGNFKDLPNVAQGFTRAMVRAVTDELAKLAVAPILGQLRGIFGGGPAGTAPFGEGGAALNVLGLGASEAAASSAAAQYVVSATGRPIPSAEISAAYQAAGDQGVRDLQAGRAVVSGGQLVRSTGFGELPGPSIPSGVTSPSLLSRALPIAGNAAAFGLSAYGATQAQTPFDVGISAGLGALTGAGLGRSIGSLFDAGGVGAGTGAVVGAGINTALALLAQQEAQKQAAKQRQQAEVARAAGAGSDLVSSAGGASSVADLFRRLTAFGSGYTGGSANPAVVTSVQTPRGRLSIGNPNPYYDVASLQDLLNAPESLQASIQAGVDPNALAGPNAATSTALQKMAQDLVGQFRKTEQGVGVSQDELVMPSGLVRRTTVPASRADALNPAADTRIDQLALGALSDDDQAALLLDVLNRVAVDKDIAGAVSDPDTGQIISITRYARSTVGLPPATTPPPAPQTPPSSTPAPGPTTGDLLTGGGVLALGAAAQLADPKSILNSLLPAGWTGPDLAKLFTALLSGETPAGVGTAIAWDSGAMSNFSADTLRSAEASIKNSGQEAFTGLTADPNGPASTLGLGNLLDVLGGVGGLTSILQGAQTGNPLSIVSGIASLYSAIAGIANSAIGSTLPTIGGLINQAVGAIASAAAGGGTAGAEAAAAAVSATSLTAAAVAPLVAGAILWALTKDQTKDLQSWAVIGKTATALQTQASTAVGQALALFSSLRTRGITDPATLEQAIRVGSNALLTYYQTVQGPAGGISLADFYKFTGQDPKPLQNAVAALQQNIVDATNYLQQVKGVSYQQLGALGNPDVVLQQLRANPSYEAPYYSANANAYDTEAMRLIASALKTVPSNNVFIGGGGEAAPFLDPNATMQMFLNDKYPYAEQETPQALLQAGKGAAELAPDAVTHAAALQYMKFGGPLWAMFARLGLDKVAASPWVAGAPGGQLAVQYDPWAVVRTLTPAQLAQILSELPIGGSYASGGPSGGVGQSGNAAVGMPGDNGTGLGEGPGTF